MLAILAALLREFRLDPAPAWMAFAGFTASALVSCAGLAFLHRKIAAEKADSNHISDFASLGYLEPSGVTPERDRAMT
jgi:hypothetical protein